jgi:hypothetical protein
MRAQGESTRSLWVTRRACRVLALLTVFSALGIFGWVSSASASVECAGCSAWWHVTSGERPAHLPPAREVGGNEVPGKGQLVVVVSNLGDATAFGETNPVTIVDRLPENLKAESIETVEGAEPVGKCSHKAVTGRQGEVATCVLERAVRAYNQVEMRVNVKVEEGAKTGEENEVSVSGGGAPNATTTRKITVSSEPASFGVENYELDNEEPGGGLDTQAGSHQFQMTVTTTLNQGAFVSTTRRPSASPVAFPKDLYFKLPPGLIGNPTPFARCSLAQFFAEPVDTCPIQSIVGVAMITFDELSLTGIERVSVPLFNLEPEVGEPARFGFLVTAEVPVFIDSAVRSGEDYGVTGVVSNISQTAGLLSSEVTFWGVPGDSRHSDFRGNPTPEHNPPPLFELPTSCTGPLQSSVLGDSWTDPIASGEVPTLATTTLPALNGCNRLPFKPSLVVTPDGTEASKPTGLTIDVHNPQEESLNSEGLAEANVKTITVALPPGVSINPAGADGLQACSEGLVGFTGFSEYDPGSEPGVRTATFAPRLPGSLGSSEPFEPGVNFCANGSKIGTAKIKTPILPNPVEGSVYLASQDENPFGSLVAMYIVAEDPVSGVLIRVPGEIRLSETGQVVGIIRNSPQAPFEDAELHFFGGERAPLATPARCGPYTTSASFVPWAVESSDEAVVTAHPSSTFQITTGPNGGPCPGASLPFDPSLTAGTTSIQAGGFSPFTMTMSREDGNQDLQAISLRMPPGLLGLLSSVKLCKEPEADAGTCGPESLIGETIVSVGLGGDPFSVKGGKVYITEGYGGAPYGLSIVNPAKAGPFNLGQVVVRAKIEVNPITADLTITSDNTGPYKIPTIIDGIPLEIKHVNVTVNRPGFTFNPTDCDPMSIGGSLDSTEGSSQALSVPFQATNCAVLGFKPGFAVSTSGRTSRANGASLTVKLTYPKAPFGSQANIKSVKVDLPKQLPSRLTTLQKACTATQFEANPAGCPSASIVGHASAVTPLIPVALSGPAYFVSYGGAKFPELVIALQGYGVTLDLHGETFINKAGITSSTFKTVPDAPVGSFQLILPQGKYSALAANGNLCKSKLTMPTAFTAQNGATIKQTTPINVTGCTKTKTTKKTSKSSKHHNTKPHRKEK